MTEKQDPSESALADVVRATLIDLQQAHLLADPGSRQSGDFHRAIKRLTNGLAAYHEERAGDEVNADALRGNLLRGLQVLADLQLGQGLSAIEAAASPQDTAAVFRAQRYVRELLRLSRVEYYANSENRAERFEPPSADGGAPWVLASATYDDRCWQLLWRRELPPLA